MPTTPPMSTRWDVLLKAASVICTAVVLPGIGWAWKTGQDINEVRSRVDLLSQIMEHERAKETGIAEELRQLRASVDGLKTDVLQRLSKVETKLETK